MEKKRKKNEEKNGRGEGGGAKWWTEKGKINTNVVSSWVLVSTRQKHKINGQKEKT